MKVRAIQQGYYDHVRRRIGDVFVLKEKKGYKQDPRTNKPILEDDRKSPNFGKPKVHVFSVDDQFSERWMEKVANNTPVKVTNTKQALAAETASIKSLKSPGGVEGEEVSEDEVI